MRLVSPFNAGARPDASLRALALRDIQAKIAAMGLEVDTTTPEEFGAFIQADSDKFGKAIRQYNIRVD